MFDVLASRPLTVSFAFTVAPEVRLRLSARGLRASVGSRAARLHIAGRAGAPAGAGPITLYQSLGRPGRPPAARRGTIAARQRQLAQATQVDEAQKLNVAFQAILHLHQNAPPPVGPPVAPEPAPVDAAAVRRRLRKAALRGLGIFKRAERARARLAADRAAGTEVEELTERGRREREHVQVELDRRWTALCDNDPDVVLCTLAEAFEDNEAPAAAVSVDGSVLGLAVLVPGIEVVPERMPRMTENGGLTIQRITKTTRAAFYRLVVCGHLLATLREAFAVAPGITAIRAAVIRQSAPDGEGRRRPECLFAGRFARHAMENVLWAHANAAEIVIDTVSEAHFRLTGRTKELAPLDLAEEGELALLLGAVEPEELATARSG